LLRSPALIVGSRDLSTLVARLWRKYMENFTELIQRLLEIQSGGRPRSPEVVAEDERLMDRLRKRDLAGKLPQAAKLSQDRSEGTRVKA
jgi:hypothetical protein